MNMTRLVSLLLLLVSSASAATIELATIIMQLRSTVDTENGKLLTEILRETTDYLDSYFGAYYANAQPADYFSHAALSVNSYGIHGMDGSYISTVEFDGMLFFTVEPTPTEEFVTTLLANAFKGFNQELYIEAIMSSENEFLNDLTHIIIEVNDETVTQDNMADRNGGSNGDDSGWLNDWLESEWLVFVIYGTVGLGGAIILVCCFCLCRYCLCPKDDLQMDEEGGFPGSGAYVPKNTEIPHLSGTSKDLFKSKQETRGAGGIRPKRSLTPNSTASSNDESDIYTTKSRKSPRSPPSPVHSLASQDSSKFTYNPTQRQTANTSKSNLNLLSLSNIQIDMPSMELDAWERGDTISPITPAPFGNDISAIELGDKEKDLSLIEEGDEGTHFGNTRRGAPRRSLHNNNSNGNGQYHSRKSTSALEIRPSRSRPSPGSGAKTALPHQYQHHHQQQQGHHYRSSSGGLSYLDMSASTMGAPSRYERDDINESSTEDSSNKVVSDDSSSDVINDLRNLSRQIDRHRRGRY